MQFEKFLNLVWKGLKNETFLFNQAETNWKMEQEKFHKSKF